jgi:hypothetical protein
MDESSDELSGIRKMISFLHYNRLLLLLLLLVVGCEPDFDRPAHNYPGSITIKKNNGAATSIEVILPPGADSTRTIYMHNRKDVEALVSQLESTITDLKAASIQFPVVEPSSEQKGTEK